MKKLRKNLKNNRNGITLIALVITIIVLLILAGVTISSLSGDNGILTKAGETKEKTENVKEDELRKLTSLEATTNFENIEYYDKNGEKAIIPSGFAVSQVDGEDKINSGLVIIDPEGNEFVWIPVDNSSDEVFNKVFKIQEGYKSGNIDTVLSKSGEANAKGENSQIEETATTQQEAKEMYASVKKYGGFYIGRYEAGKGVNNELVSRKGVDVYNNIKWSANGEMQETEGIEGGAVELSRNFAKNKKYESVKSTLCYGVQWDAVMNFIDPNYITKAEIQTPNCVEDSYVRNSTNQGNYRDTDDTNNPSKTGVKKEYAIKNIYDLAGNVGEWTMESYGTGSRFNRGGDYRNNGSSNPASYRGSGYPKNSSLNIGFRFTLYL